jgi:hypothetical protein
MTVLHEVLSCLCRRDADATPVLRHRSATGAVRDLVTSGLVDQWDRL